MSPREPGDRAERAAPGHDFTSGLEDPRQHDFNVRYAGPDRAVLSGDDATIDACGSDDPKRRYLPRLAQSPSAQIGSQLALSLSGIREAPDSELHDPDERRHDCAPRRRWAVVVEGLRLRAFSQAFEETVAPSKRGVVCDFADTRGGAYRRAEFETAEVSRPAIDPLQMCERRSREIAEGPRAASTAIATAAPEPPPGGNGPRAAPGAENALRPAGRSETGEGEGRRSALELHEES